MPSYTDGPGVLTTAFFLNVWSMVSADWVGTTTGRALACLRLGRAGHTVGPGRDARSGAAGPKTAEDARLSTLLLTAMVRRPDHRLLTLGTATLGINPRSLDSAIEKIRARAGNICLSMSRLRANHNKITAPMLSGVLRPFKRCNIP